MIEPLKLNSEAAFLANSYTIMVTNDEIIVDDWDEEVTFGVKTPFDE